ITQTVTPTWINTVPHNYGESNAGTIKADEWRTVSTLYLPLALVLMWLDGAPEDDDEEAARQLRMLDHSMSLFQAVILSSPSSSLPSRLRSYVKPPGVYFYTSSSLRSLRFPSGSVYNTNIHVAFHIYNFLRLFGPVISWWCFPFERVIGYLQKIHTTNRVG
ncbi:hypothetical protein C8R44DRAFT_538521, partial [Mycena epipterygia]